MADVMTHSQGPSQLTIDLLQQRITDANDRVYEFTINAAAKGMLVEGLDEIALTLQHLEDIEKFERQDAVRRPWVYL